jgi:hypothetical protein
MDNPGTYWKSLHPQTLQQGEPGTTWKAPQRYLDASISFKIDKCAGLFVDGTDLTNGYQHHDPVWPDQPAHSNFSERMSMAGIRGPW